ncbi:MAG TPA: asparagine synthase (glutamine-hydrolyzing) [Terriglobales bacterium]|nr:asparagine synthase (glutamine-hydrolyzing) [Terriglobales bacterium]
MNHAQAHRGPNDRGIWERRFPDGQYMGLGSQRLAIQDLSPSGHMPMCNEDGAVWITYNGEIYNFLALRRELEQTGHHFISRSDTEVVLHLYEEEGSACVQRLNGMFAFAICDLRGSTPMLFMARDHFGIKPFYYRQRGCSLGFASEIKALLQVPGMDAELDHEALHQYLTFLWVPDPKTLFSGIYKLPAGHFAIFQDGSLRIEKYWDLEFPTAEAHFPTSEEQLAGEIRERLRSAVEAQMVSDVPVGAFLSAGLDSSSIVAMMAAKRSAKTYTITFPKKYRVGENTLDDPAVAARIARKLGCENEQIIVEPDVTSLLPKLIWHMDEPVADPAIIAAYLVCREASRSATVLLSGVGGDEVFAGYRKYSAYYWAQAYRRLPSGLQAAINTSLLHLPSFRGSRIKGALRLAKKMARSASLSPVDAFVMNCTYLDDEQKAALYSPAFARELVSGDAAVEHHSVFKRMEDADFLNRMLYADTKIFMTSLNLTYNDKMSMASSVEVRVPFLDRELVEFVAARVAPRYKVKGIIAPATKYILRKAMAHLLPREVLRQPKAGFAAPADYWLANDMVDMIDDVLSESQMRKRDIFNPGALRTMIDEHRNGRQDWSMQIWQFLTLELWMQTFLDRPAARCSEVVGMQVATA